MESSRVQRYSLEGSYQYNGSTERQKGNLTLADGWIVYGEISDDTWRKDDSVKRVIGMRFSDNGALGMFKLPVDLGLAPILWYLKPERGANTLGGREAVYKGVFGAVEGPIPDMLQQVVASTEGLITLESLTGLDSGEMEMGVFPRSVLRDLERISLPRGQTGEMRFDLVE